MSWYAIWGSKRETPGLAGSKPTMSQYVTRHLRSPPHNTAVGKFQLTVGRRLQVACDTSNLQIVTAIQEAKLRLLRIRSIGLTSGTVRDSG